MINHERTESGSILVIVLAVVCVAALIAISYLAFVDNQRARAGRNVDQDAQRISIEQAVLALKSNLRSELLANGSLDLASLDREDELSGFSLKLSSQMHSPGLLKVQPFADAADPSELPNLEDQDLFGLARARTTVVDIDVIVKPNLATARLNALNVIANPQIAVREIPVSQFTVFSFGDPFSVDGTVFKEDIGRVFSESSLSLSTSVSSQFTVLAGQDVNLAEGASLQVHDPSRSNVSVKLSSGTQNPDFLAEARTKLNSRVITGNILPVDSAPLNMVYGENGTAQGTTGLNLTLLQAQCDLLVVASPDTVITMPNGTKGYLVTAVGRTVGNVNGLTYPSSGSSAAHQGQGNSGVQTVPFAAAPDNQNHSQIILAFDYAQLRAAQFSSVFLAVQTPAGVPVPNAIVLVRGAQTLGHPISIVSPHPIVIAGDFNTGQDSKDTPASFITPENVQTAPANWESDLFGDVTVSR